MKYAGQQQAIKPEHVRIGLGIAAGALIVGAFMPWLTASAPFVGTITRSGMDANGDGWLIILAAVVTIFTITKPATRARGWFALVAGAFAALVAFTDFNDVNSRLDAAKAKSALIQGSVGIGLWLCILAAIVIFVGAIHSLNNVYKTPKVADTADDGEYDPGTGLPIAEVTS